MSENMNDKMNFDWSSLNTADKKRQLFLSQKRTLDTFLEHGAISKAQYNKSYYDLIEKMDMTDLASEGEEREDKTDGTDEI